MSRLCWIGKEWLLPERRRIWLSCSVLYLRVLSMTGKLRANPWGVGGFWMGVRIGWGGGGIWLSVSFLYLRVRSMTGKLRANPWGLAEFRWRFRIAECGCGI